MNFSFMTASGIVFARGAHKKLGEYIKGMGNRALLICGNSLKGEKMDAIEPFHPDRMASRILGMGDVLSLIEKAEAAYDQKKAAEMEKKIRESSFTLEDYLDQFKQVRKMGSIEQLAGMIPGIKQSQLKDAKIDEKQIDRMEAIILSMTKKERNNAAIINGSRKKRIAAGSGTTVEEVNKLLNQYTQVNKMMKQLASGKMGMLGNIFGRKGRMPF